MSWFLVAMARHQQKIWSQWIDRIKAVLLRYHGIYTGRIGAPCRDQIREGMNVPRKPNYKFERLERERAKAAKKAARLEAKKEKAAQKKADIDAPSDTPDEPLA